MHLPPCTSRQPPCNVLVSCFSPCIFLYHIFPYGNAVYTLAAADGIRTALTPAAEYFNTLGVPEWLVHWGHPGNMAVVLFAMGGYGAGYLG